MTTQYTSILKLALPVQGELSGTWGDVVNDNITSMVEEAVAGRAVINTWTTNSHTLTTADGTTAESRCAMLEFTDTGAALTGAATVVCPSLSKLYVCKNDSGQQVTIKTSAGTGVAIPDGQTMFVFCDGTNVEQCTTNFNSLSFNDYTLSFGGAVTTAGAFTTSGAYALTLTTTGATNVTLPTTGTLATLDGTETLTNKTLTAPTISSPTLTGSISATDLTISGDTTIGDAAADGLTVNATITSNLIFTDNTYDIGASGATRPRNLFLAGNATIGGTVTLSGGIDVTGALGVDGDFDVNTDKFTVASATGNTLVAGTLGVTGATTATGGLNVDTISEITAAGGVTIDSVVLKDGGATLTSDLVVSTDKLFVDVSGSKVGINEDEPDEALVVKAAEYSGSINGGIAVQAGDHTSTHWKSAFKIKSTSGGVPYTTIDATTGATDGTVYEALSMWNAEVVFNEDSADRDFRIESDSNTHAFFLDASTSNIGINTPSNLLDTSLQVYTATSAAITPLIKLQGNHSANDSTEGTSIDFVESGDQTAVGSRIIGTRAASGANMDLRFHTGRDNFAMIIDESQNVGIGETDPLTLLHMKSSSSGELLRIESTDGGAGEGPVLGLYRNSGSPANSDILGTVKFYGEDSAGNLTTYASIYSKIADVNNGTEDGVLYLKPKRAAALIEGLTLSHDEAVINNESYDYNFRVESNANTHMLFVDAGNNRLGVNTSNPSFDVDIQGANPQVNIEATTDNWSALRITAGATQANYMFFFDDTAERARISVLDGEDFQISTGSSPVQRMSLDAGATVFNDTGADTDFRVESDSNTHMLFINAGTNKIGINSSNPQTILEIVDSNPKLRLEDSASGSKRIDIGVTSGAVAFVDAPQSAQTLRNSVSGTESLTQYHNTDGVVVNEGGADRNFRIESSSTQNQFFLDGGTGLIGINDGSPSNHLDIAGSLSFERVASRNVSTGAVANNYFVIYDLDFSSSGFSTNQHIIRIIAAGSTSGQMASADLLVTFKQQGTGRFFNIVPIQNDNLTLGYIWDASGGGTSNGNLKIYCQGPAAYSYVQVYATNRDGNPTENIIAGTFPMTDTGSAAAPAGMTSIESPLNYSGNKYNQNGRVDNTFVINEASHDINFRVESDSNTHALFVDAGNGHVNINTSADAGGTLNVAGDIYNDLGNDKYFRRATYIDPRGVSDGVYGGYLLLVPYNSGSAAVGAAMEGTFIASRGNSGTGNGPCRCQVWCSAVYTNTLAWFKKEGADQFFQRLVRVTYSGTEYMALEFDQVNGGPVNGIYFDGWSLRADSNFLYMVRDTEITGSAVAYDKPFPYHTIETTGNQQFEYGVTFNEAGGDHDFRVESDAVSNCLVVDAGNNTVSMHCDTSYSFGSGTQTGTFFANGGFIGHTENSNNAALILRKLTNTGTMVRFYQQNSVVGSISTTASATAYNTTSDERLKENIADAQDAGELIDAIQVRQFDWKETGEHQRYGVVAQEVDQVTPEITSTSEEDGFMSVDYSKLVPMLIKEIQSLRARVAQLESN